MTEPVPDAAAQLQLVIKNSGVTKPEFEQLLETPYDEAIAAIRSAVERGAADIPFASHSPLAPAWVLRRAEGEISREDVLVCQVLADRLFTFYAIRAFDQMPADVFDRRVKLIGFEKFKAAAASPRGVCLINSHFGSPLATVVILARLGYDVTQISARDFYPALAPNSCNRISVLEAAHLSATSILTSGISALSSGAVLNTAGDGGKGESNKVLPFLNREMEFRRGFAYMALEGNAHSMPTFFWIDSKGDAHLEFCDPIQSEPVDMPKNDRIDALVTAYGKSLERKWRTMPWSVVPKKLREFSRAERREKTG